MPSIVERLVAQLQEKGVANAHPVAVTQLQKAGILKPGSDSELTPLGKIRDAMTPGERAVSRAVKASNGAHHKTDYVYNPKTNCCSLKQRR